MNNLGDVKFIDASDWVYLSWYSSGGTRAKRVLLSPDGAEYFFKRSEKKPAKDGKPEKYYKYEFWSEIIAYQIGKLLGLDILRYDVAIHNEEIGCISPMMIKSDKEQLLEIGRYMTSLNPDFLPEDTKTRTEYSFELLENTLKQFKLDVYLPQIFDTLLFDCIIGNTDRHQENWAFIGKNTLIKGALSQFEGELKKRGIDKMGWLFKKLYSRFVDKEKNQFNHLGKQIQLISSPILKMAPIYDSGSSMAREINDGKVNTLLSDDQEFNRYVENGKAEIHWQKRKISHFELIENLMNSSYLGEIQKSSGFFNEWNNTSISQIVNDIDKGLPEKYNSYLIPKERKELIVKLLISRFNRLNNLLSARV
jgi:hypothetical protein